MARVIFVNGAYRSYAQAVLHVEDRSVQFADAVYEVCEIRDRLIVDERLHMERLQRSLRELRFDPDAAPQPRALGVILRETVRRNAVRDGLVYIQITRGAARRDFPFPPADTPCGVICFARSTSRARAEAKALKGLKVVTVPDIRWRRPDIKSTSLLPNALAKQTARDAGADDAWFVDDTGHVTEGASNNAWIVTASGALVTRPADFGILRGVTRQGVLKLAALNGYNVEERAFTVAEAKAAKEAFLTSASALVLPVVAIDGAVVGDGSPGRFTLDLRRMFHHQAETSTLNTLLA
ncbi:MAG: D-amino-acid transaminase [Hyphomicrobiales bacterium]|nr:D-amino-acid transaminase [Hyphomicrobiales bacterium]